MEHNLNLFVDKPDILILTETWLDKYDLNPELNLKEYLVYRTDRSVPRCINDNCPSRISDSHTFGEIVECSCETKRGGGVIIAIKRSLTSSAIDITSNYDEISCVEEVYVTVCFGDVKYLLSALYMPPYATDFDYLVHIENIENIIGRFRDHKLIICGDFNLPKVCWYYQDGLRYSTQTDCDPSTKQCANLLFNFYSTFNFSQVFPNHTRKNYTLDLMFADFNTVHYYHSSDQLLPLDKQHHESATFILQNKSS